MTKIHSSLTNIFFITTLFFLVFPTSTLARRYLPDFTLSLPVLITLDKKYQASAFYILDNNKQLYLVTARHVLLEEIKKEPYFSLRNEYADLVSYSEDSKDTGCFKLILNLKVLQTKKLIKYHTNHDVAIIKIGIRTKEDGQEFICFFDGVQLVQSTSKPLSFADATTDIKKFDDVLISNEIFIFGYPTSLGIPEMPQLEYDKPLLRKGIVAGKNISKMTLILDSPVYYGNSGGPVIEVEQVELVTTRYRLIGVVSQFIPFEEEWENKKHHIVNKQISNSGYSIVVPNGCST